MDLNAIEETAIWAALVGYVVACTVAIIGVVFRRSPEKTILGLISLSVALHTVALAARWIHLERLPVIGMYEMLSGNVWGLMMAVTIAYWLYPRIRPFAALAMPIVIMVVAWMLLKPDESGAAPATYDTIWLYVHIAFIKLFIGCAFVALAVAGIVLARRTAFGASRFESLPDDRALDERAYRFMALALIFDSMGVVAGAIWAKDAWGRYWSWDTLEVWSLVTWLCIGLTLHVRASFRTPPTINALLILGTFMVAFFTFFGVPFVSTALHKGQI